MKFRIGQMVRVLRGMYGGEVTTVTSELLDAEHFDNATKRMTTGPVYLVAITPPPGYRGICYRPGDLEPFHDPSDFATLAELLRAVRGEPVKERV